jgi:preprotein translocase subunit YajC
MKKIIVILIFSLLFTISAFAQLPQAQPPAPPSFTEMLAKMLPLFAMVFFVFYVLVFRPQQKKLREHQKLVEGLKKGDAVVTSSGIIARIFAVEDDAIVLEVAPNTRMRFEKAHVTKRVAPTSSVDKGAASSKTAA